MKPDYDKYDISDEAKKYYNEQSNLLEVSKRLIQELGEPQTEREKDWQHLQIIFAEMVKNAAQKNVADKLAHKKFIDGIKVTLRKLLIPSDN